VVVLIFSIALDSTDSFIKRGEINIFKLGINEETQFKIDISCVALIANFKNLP
jgi:hypothetical protein